MKMTPTSTALICAASPTVRAMAFILFNAFQKLGQASGPQPVQRPFVFVGELIDDIAVFQ